MPVSFSFSFPFSVGPANARRNRDIASPLWSADTGITKCLSVVWLIALLFSVPALAVADDATPPNIVLIVADDLGWNAVGYHEGFAKTPNIDRIARRGVQLDKFYVSPMCSPTRAGIMTGRYPIRFGMARTVVRPWADFGLPPNERMLPERLAEVGYEHRGAFGKWHLGHLRPEWHPLTQGFTEFKGHYNGAEDYWTHDREGENDWHVDDEPLDEPLDEPGYQTGLVGDAAANFITGHAGDDSPYFVYVPFMAPHAPMQAPQERIDAQPAFASKDKRILSAMIGELDDIVGKLMNAIDASGEAENTLVIFMSDNGGVGNIPGNNKPLKGSKLTAWEGGIRVPAAAWWPGHIEGGRTIDTPLINLDWLPTLLAAGGRPIDDDVDGKNALPLLIGEAESLPPRDLYYYHGQNGPDAEWLAMRSADGWKLVIHGPDVRTDGWESARHDVALFKIDDDPNEQNRIESSHPDIVRALGEKLLKFRQLQPEDATGAPNQMSADFKIPPQWRNPLPTNRPRAP